MNPDTSSHSARITVQIDSALKDLIPTFLANRRRDVETLTQALDTGDFRTIGALGHRLKGDGGGYGFQDITDVGATIEQAASRKDGECISRQIAKFRHYLDHIDIVFMD